MKLQSLSIIFIIIVFPLILVLSYYISLQIDTVTLYNKYNNELIDATNDAMSAFELNTANENLSNVSDSLRTIINASTNTFINTFSTSLGLSNAHKNDIEPYIPSILYTMYDGYYIYSPTKTPKVLEETVKNDTTGIITSNGAKYNDDGVLLYEHPTNINGTTNISEAVMQTDYVLKSYMPYSATYHEDSNNNGKVDNNEKVATINYTLDNFMSVSAQIGNIYYTKSGYYIKTDLVSYCDKSGWKNMGQDELKEFCLDVNNGIKITVNGVDIETTVGATDAVSEANRKAITYYLTNTAFSNWVNTNLGFVTGDNLQTVINFADPESIGYSLENMNAMYHNFSGEGCVFVTEDPEDEHSNFNNHKYNIIKNSIQYNLNLAISSYNNMFQGIEFSMPQLLDEQWEEITKKISIVTFAQGLDCGLKKYNGYAVISSTNNEMTVIPEEIYYVKSGEFNNESSYYHRIDCETIRGETGDFISFKSKEVKYDDIYIGDTTVGEGYEYDHKNLACYDCIVQNNYSNYDTVGRAKKIKLRAFLGLELDRDTTEEVDYINTETVTSNLKNLQRAYYIAIGKERQNLYKTTAYSKNEGIYIDNNPTYNKIKFNGNVYKAEITLVYNGDYGIVGEIQLYSSPTSYTSTGKMISTSTRSNQTIELLYDNDSEREIKCNTGSIDVLSIKYIYK